MKQTILLLFTGLVVLGCSQPKSDQPQHSTNQDTLIKNANTQPAPKMPSADNEQPYPKWMDSLITSYVKETDNLLVKNAVKKKLGEEWVFDQSLKTDTATYCVFNIGHDVSDNGNTNTRYISDSWIYIDSLTKKLYEYNSDKLVEWKKK